MAFMLGDNTVRVTATLNEVLNDTGRIAYCGPYVVSAITGFPISKIEDEIRAFREVPVGIKTQVRGTYAEEVSAALVHYGYEMNPHESFMHLERKARPSVWSWMQKPRNAWTHYVLAVHKGKDGHWIVIKGVKSCDTFSGGKWQFVCDGPHKGARIMEIFTARKSLGL